MVKNIFGTCSKKNIKLLINENKDFIKKQFQSSDMSFSFKFKLTVNESINKLFAQGYFKRVNYCINYCCKTNISDDDIDFTNKKQTIFYIKYFYQDSKNYITVATTKPVIM